MFCYWSITFLIIYYQLFIFDTGLRIFLKEVSFYAMFSNELLNQCDETNRIIHRELMNGMKQGTVKPLKNTILSMPFTSEKLFDSLKYS